MYLDFAPPPVPYAAVPAPRAGFIWAPGYYEHDHGKYHWRGGHWENERRGYSYHPGSWDNREGHYYYNEPGWHQEHSPG